MNQLVIEYYEPISGPLLPSIRYNGNFREFAIETYGFHHFNCYQRQLLSELHQFCILHTCSRIMTHAFDVIYRELGTLGKDHIIKWPCYNCSNAKLFSVALIIIDNESPNNCTAPILFRLSKKTYGQFAKVDFLYNLKYLRNSLIDSSGPRVKADQNEEIYCMI